MRIVFRGSLSDSESVLKRTSGQRTMTEIFQRYPEILTVVHLRDTSQWTVTLGQNCGRSIVRRYEDLGVSQIGGGEGEGPGVETDSMLE